MQSISKVITIQHSTIMIYNHVVGIYEFIKFIRIIINNIFGDVRADEIRVNFIGIISLECCINNEMMV